MRNKQSSVQKSPIEEQEIRFSGLEVSIFNDVIAGQQISEIAESHSLSDVTIAVIANSIMHKMGCRNLRSAAQKWAHAHS